VRAGCWGDTSTSSRPRRIEFQWDLSGFQEMLTAEFRSLEKMDTLRTIRRDLDGGTIRGCYTVQIVMI
jgi:hypothetical protein